MSHPSTSIIWVHGDNLNPESQVWQQFPEAPAVWVWDEDLLQAWQISFKRIVFLYECLLELPVEICRGNVVQELSVFATKHQAQQIVTSPSPSPRFRAICQQLPVPVEIIPEPEFVTIPDSVDLKRFSRYWRVAKENIMKG